MRRELVWALAACLLLSAWALLSPAAKPGVTGVVAPAARAPAILTDSSPTPRAKSDRAGAEAVDTTLPPTWPAPAMEPATRSPFASLQSPAPKAVASAPTPSPQVGAPPRPEVAYRFWGGLTTPTGEHLVYVAREDNQGQPIAVRVGTKLDGGFAVEQVTPGAIVLVDTGTQRRVTLSTSPPPSGGLR